MQNRNEQVDQVREFLALYPMDMWWPDLNSECRPLAAETTVGVYSLIRICCPALGDARDAIVAGMVRAAGFRLAPRDGGGYVVERKCSTGRPPAEDSSAESPRLVAVPSA